MTAAGEILLDRRTHTGNRHIQNVNHHPGRLP